MAASGTVCFEVLASAQAALAEILGPENVSRGLPEATAEAVLAKLTDLFVQLVRETAAETAGQPGARRTGPGAASAATGVPRANFGAQPEPDNRDLPEPEESHLEANPTGEVQVQVVTVTAGNKAATWTGSLRPETGRAAWEGELQAHAKVFGKMNADAPGSDQLAVAAGSIVAEHHQSPPVDQSAEASPEAREYAEIHRLIVAAVARVLHDGGNARASLSPQRRRQLATNLSDRLSRDLGTRARRSAAPIGAGRDRHGNYTPSGSAGAGPSGTTRIPATAPDQATSSRTGAQPGTVRHRDTNSSDEERGGDGRRIRPRLSGPPESEQGHPAPAAGLPDPSRETAGLVDSLRRDTRPIPHGENPVRGRAAPDPDAREAAAKLLVQLGYLEVVPGTSVDSGENAVFIDEVAWALQEQGTAGAGIAAQEGARKRGRLMRPLTKGSSGRHAERTDRGADSPGHPYSTRRPAPGARRATGPRPTSGQAARPSREGTLDPAQHLLVLVRSKVTSSRPGYRISSITPELISAVSQRLPVLINRQVPTEARAAQIADMIVLNGFDRLQDLVATRPTAGSAAAPALGEAQLVTGEYSSGGSGGRSLVSFMPTAVRMRSFTQSAQRPAGISLANPGGTDFLDRFLANVWTVPRLSAPFDSFLLPARAEDAMEVDETGGGLTVASPWHVDSRRGGTFFVGLRGSVIGQNGVPLFGIEAENGGTLGVDAAVLAHLLLSDVAFEEAMDEGAASVTMLGWDDGIPATLADGLAGIMQDLLHREVSVYAATGTVVFGRREDGANDDRYIGVDGGGHWQVSGYRDPEHDSGIASELASALSNQWRYARPPQAESAGDDESPIDESDRYHTLRLTESVLRSIQAGLGEEPGVLSLEHAAQRARRHVNPNLPMLAALKLVTRDREVAASVRLVRDAWRVQADGTEKWELLPVAREIWSRLGGTPGPTAPNGRQVIREPSGTAPAMAGSLTIRPRQELTSELQLELTGLARQLAEAARPGLGGVAEHADIVVYGGSAGDKVARGIRRQLVSEAERYLGRLGINVPDLARQVILPVRRAAEASADADTRVELVIQSRADLVREEYGWLSSVNPRRSEGGHFMTNCALAAIAVDKGLETGEVDEVASATTRGDRFFHEWAQSNGRMYYRVGRGLGAIIEAMADAEPGARAVVTVSYRSGRGHAFNAVRHSRLGVVFLDGQTGSGDPLSQMRAFLEEPAQTWFVPMTDDIEGVGVPFSPEKVMEDDGRGPLGARFGMPPFNALIAQAARLTIGDRADHAAPAPTDEATAAQGVRVEMMHSDPDSGALQQQALRGRLARLDLGSGDYVRVEEALATWGPAQGYDTGGVPATGSASGGNHPGPLGLAAGRPDRDDWTGELVSYLDATAGPAEAGEQAPAGLGPDLFGSRTAPAAPDFLQGVRFDEIATDQLVAFFGAISMTNGAPPAPGELLPETLASDPDSVLAIELDSRDLAWAGHVLADDDPLRLLPSTLLEVPTLAVAIWLGGPPNPADEDFWQGLEEINSSLDDGIPMVLLTDVPRSQVEAARNVYARGDGEPAAEEIPGDGDGPIPDRDLAERARRLAAVDKMLSWAIENQVLLVNIDEISHAGQELALDHEYRAELARRTHNGYARASDILRFSFAERFGALLYTDHDNGVSPELAGARDGAFRESLEDLFAQQGWAMHINDEFSIANAAFMAARHHRFAQWALREMGRRYGLTQSELYGDRYQTVQEPVAKDDERVNRHATHPRYRVRRTSVMWRTGPYVLEPFRYSDAPRVDQLRIGQAGTWRKGHPLGAQRAYLGDEVRRVVQDVTATLVRDLYNRQGDLHVTLVAPVVAGLPDPDAGWRAAVGFILSRPDLRPLVKTVTDRMVWAPDGENPETVVVLLPDDVRGWLGVPDLEDGQSAEGTWILGELGRPASIDPSWQAGSSEVDRRVQLVDDVVASVRQPVPGARAGAARAGGSVPSVDELQWAAAEADLRRHANALGKSREDGADWEQLYGAAGDIVAQHHQSPPTDQSADASPSARQYGDRYRLIVQAVARMLHDGGEPGAPLPPEERTRRAEKLSERLSLDLNTRRRASAALPGRGRGQRDEGIAPRSVGAGPSGAAGTGEVSLGLAAGLPEWGDRTRELVRHLMGTAHDVLLSGPPGLGPDVFGLRSAPPAPDFLQGVRFDEIATDQLAAFFRRISMTNKTRPAPGELTPRRLPHEPGTVLTTNFARAELAWWSQMLKDNTLPFQFKDQKVTVPRFVTGIWLGGPPTGGDEFWVNWEGITRSLHPGSAMVLLTDVPRSLIEDARDPFARIGPGYAAGPGGDQDRAELARRHSRAREMLTWAASNQVLLVNVDEISHLGQELRLDDAYRAELARRTANGYARAADILRLSFAERFGTLLYTDHDNAVGPEFRGAQAGAFQDSLEELFQVRGWATLAHKGSPANGALMAARHHPLPRYLLDDIARRYELTQRELYTFYDLFQPVPESPHMNKELARRWVTGEPHIRGRRTSTVLRTGPVFPLAYEPPLITQLAIGEAGTWQAGHPLQAQHAYLGDEVPRVVRDVTATLVRDLYNREGDLHLTLVARVIQGLAAEDRDAAWRAAVWFILSRPHLRELIKMVTDRELWSPDGQSVEPVVVPLPPDVRGWLRVPHVEDSQPVAGTWLLGELGRPTRIGPSWQAEASLAGHSRQPLVEGTRPGERVPGPGRHPVRAGRGRGLASPDGRAVSRPPSYSRPRSLSQEQLDVLVPRVNAKLAEMRMPAHMRMPAVPPGAVALAHGQLGVHEQGLALAERAAPVAARLQEAAQSGRPAVVPFPGSTYTVTEPGLEATADFAIWVAGEALERARAGQPGLLVRAEGGGNGGTFSRGGAEAVGRRRAEAVLDVLRLQVFRELERLGVPPGLVELAEASSRGDDSTSAAGVSGLRSDDERRQVLVWADLAAPNAGWLQAMTRAARSDLALRGLAGQVSDASVQSAFAAMRASGDMRRVVRPETAGHLVAAAIADAPATPPRHAARALARPSGPVWVANASTNDVMVRGIRLVLERRAGHQWGGGPSDKARAALLDALRTYTRGRQAKEDAVPSRPASPASEKAPGSRGADAPDAATGGVPGPEEAALVASVRANLARFGVQRAVPLREILDLDEELRGDPAIGTGTQARGEKLAERIAGMRGLLGGAPAGRGGDGASGRGQGAMAGVPATGSVSGPSHPGRSRLPGWMSRPNAVTPQRAQAITDAWLSSSRLNIGRRSAGVVAIDNALREWTRALGVAPGDVAADEAGRRAVEDAVARGLQAEPLDVVARQAGTSGSAPDRDPGPRAAAIAEVLRFSADGTGRRVNLPDHATEDQLDAIGRRGGLASLDAVEELAARIADAFTDPADGADGPPADVALTLTIPAGRTPDSITSGGQIVQAVATKLKHPVFMHLEETGVEFKICW